jgi:hypothetical protein
VFPRAAIVCAACLACTAQGFAGGPATTTTLAITSNGSPVSTLIQGNLITLTASVTSGSTPLTVGQVEFCDASWPHCTDVHQLALAQLTSAGTATFRFVPRAGAQQYKAIFLGANSYASSTSSAQQLTVTSSGFTYLSSATLVSSGSPGDYTLTATVTGGGDPAPPSGTVSFLDTDNANYVLGTATLTAVGQFDFDNFSYIPSGAGFDLGSFAVGDFNGDGIPDVAMSTYMPSGSSRLVTIMLGKGDGTFTQGQTLTLPSNEQPQQIAVADFNNDGVADLAIEEWNGSATNPIYWIQIALGNGDGTFTLSPPMALPEAAGGDIYDNYLVGDFNGDGKADLVITYQALLASGVGTRNLGFLSGNGDGTFAPMTLAYQTTNPIGLCVDSMVVADFNGDGNLDLACANDQTDGPNPGPNSISVLLGDGHGSFSYWSNVTVGAGLTYIAVADFNGDGKADLATASYYYSTGGTAVASVSVALGNGDGTFAASTPLPVSVNAPDFVVAGDFNGDGIPDFAVPYAAAGIGGHLFTVYLGNGDGTFSANNISISPQFISGPGGVASDFNRDGRWDLALPVEPPAASGIFLSVPSLATATVTGISPVGTGIHPVDASYPGLATVLAPSISNTVGLEAEPVATTLTLFAAPATGVSMQPFTLIATASPTTAQNHAASGTVTFYNGGVSLGTGAFANGVATLTISTGLPIGTYNLTATYSGDTNFTGSTGSLEYVVSASPPPIVFTVPNHTFGDPPFTVAATSSSPGAFTYSVLSGPATISGTIVTLTGVGTVVLQVNQAASGSFPALTQNAAFTVAQEAQTIAFAAPASPVIPSVGPVTLSASASSGLPVSFSVVSGPATLSGSTVTVTGVGAVVVAANQAGNADYLAAAQVTRTIVVSKGLPMVTLAASQNPVLLQNPVTLTATVAFAAATPTGSVTFTDGSTVLGAATLNSGAASITASTLVLGANPIAVAYSGDGNYNTATGPPLNEAVQDFTLTITGNPAQTVPYGGTATYALAVASVDGSSLPSAIGFAVSGAPNGSAITFSPATLPAGSGASSLTLTIQVPGVFATNAPLRGTRTPTALALLALVLPFRRGLKHRGKFAGWMSCILLLVATACASAALAGCGGSIVTPITRTYAVTVTATSGALSHATSVGLTVQ